MPNQPKTRHRGFRIPEPLYFRALAIAKWRGTTLAAEVRVLLTDYVRRGEKAMRAADVDLDELTRAEQDASRRRGDTN